MSEAVSSIEAYTSRNKSRLGIIVLLSCGVLFSLCLDISVGPGQFTLNEVIRTLLFPDSQSNKLVVIVWKVRLPIALMAVVVGAMLAVAGAQIQTILDNPLAEPYTLGFASAASFGASLVFVFGVSLVPVGAYFAATANAFICTMIAALCIYFYSFYKGGAKDSLILIGIANFFIFNALLTLAQYSADEAALHQVIFWMMGSLSRTNWGNLAICAGVFFLVLPIFIHQTWKLNAINLGDEKATSLGIDVRRLRLSILILVALVSATAVSFVGTIGFIGLVGPHIARMLVGEEQRFFLPVAALAGALILSLSSIVSKMLLSGAIIPIGIVTAIVGIPAFISLLWTKNFST